MRQKEEFNTLLQGTKSVWDYHADFVTLAIYAAHLRDDEPRLARKFRSGLRFEIIRRMAGVTANTVAQMVEIAQNVEIDINLEKTARPSEDAKGKGKLHAGTPSWKRRKAGSGISMGTRTTLSGEEPCTPESY